jgi:hypothetical protein
MAKAWSLAVAPCPTAEPPGLSSRGAGLTSPGRGLDAMVGERSRPWSPFFNSEQAIVKWPLVTRLLGEGRLNLDLDSLRFWYGRWPTPNPPRIRLIREAEVRGCIVLDGLGMLVSQRGAG